MLNYVYVYVIPVSFHIDGGDIRVVRSVLLYFEECMKFNSNILLILIWTRKYYKAYHEYYKNKRLNVIVRSNVQIFLQQWYSCPNIDWH